MFKLVTPIYAEVITDWNKSPTAKGGVCAKDDVATIQGLECLFANILQVITLLAGLVFIFMFISGAFTYLFSGGDEKKIAQASSTLGSSFLGLVGIIVSWLILKFLADFTGVNLLDFIIPSNMGTST